MAEIKPKGSAVIDHLYASSTRRACLALALVVLGGCASVVSGPRQDVTVQVLCKDRQVAASCHARNSKGSWNFNTPETRSILRDGSPLRVACYSSVVGEYGVYQYPGVNPLSAGNAVVGGLVGAAVDAGGNSLWQYPSVISIESELCKRMPS